MKQTFSIQFFYQNQQLKKFPVDQTQLNKIAIYFQEFLPLKLKGIVNVNIINDQKMRLILEKYYPFKNTTDILSFPYVNVSKIQDSNTLLGEIYLAFPQIKRQAKIFHHSLERESTYLLVHGLLHLLGYDHKDISEKTVMRYWEEFFVTEKLQIKR